MTMAEHYCASILVWDVPGPLPAEVVQAFERLDAEARDSFPNGDGVEITLEHGRRCAYYNDSLAGADDAFDHCGVTRALRRAGLAYRIVVDQDWGIAMRERYWQPGMDAEEVRPVDGDGEPTITLAEVREVVSRNNDAARALAELEHRLGHREPPAPGADARWPRTGRTCAPGRRQ
jgi:hypothetical protein